MRHVLFLPKWYPNALDPFDGNFVENHAQALKSIADISVLFVHSLDSCRRKYEIETTNKAGLTEIRVYFNKAQSGLKILDQITSFFRYRKAQLLGYEELLKQKAQPDLVHVHVLSRPALLALRLKTKYAIPFLITEHWSGYLKSNGKYSGFLKKQFTQWVVKQASLVHTVSSQLMDAMKSHNLHNRYLVMPNVVDEKLFKPAETQHERIEIIFVGNLLESPKRIFRIITAMKRLKDAEINFRLSIYGEGKDEAAAKSLSAKLGLEQVISFCGTRDRKGIAEAMANSDFLVLFSEFENQPCVIAEAQVSGIPVLVPDLPGIKELMNPDLGILVETGNQVAFEEALLELAKTHSSYAKDKIRAYGMAHFSEKAIADKFEQVYQDILNQQHG